MPLLPPCTQARVNRRGRRSNLGLTIIELTIVLGLIGVLAAIALPSYSIYQDKVRQRKAAIEINAIGTSLKLRWQDDRAYPASLADAGLGTPLDPWGRPYVYYNVEANGRGGARKDRALNPINTDFDLYSMGPDGLTQKQVSQKDSLDDIIRANNGAFTGVAADF